MDETWTSRQIARLEAVMEERDRYRGNLNTCRSLLFVANECLRNLKEVLGKDDHRYEEISRLVESNDRVMEVLR